MGSGLSFSSGSGSKTYAQTYREDSSACKVRLDFSLDGLRQFTTDSARAHSPGSWQRIFSSTPQKTPPTSTSGSRVSSQPITPKSATPKRSQSPATSQTRTVFSDGVAHTLAASQRTAYNRTSSDGLRWRGRMDGRTDGQDTRAHARIQVITDESV